MIIKLPALSVYACACAGVLVLYVHMDLHVYSHARLCSCGVVALRHFLNDRSPPELQEVLNLQSTHTEWGHSAGISK